MADGHPDRSLIPGWSYPGEFEALAAHAAGCPGPWVEIGSYCGRSTAYLSDAAPEGVVIFAVDPHRGNPEMAPGHDCHHPEVWARENGSLSMLLDLGLPNVVPVVGSSEQFARTGVRPGFVFIDGDHSYEGCRRDVDLWGPLLAAGGLLAMHDTSDGRVAEVVDEMLAEGWRCVDHVESLKVFARSPA